MSDKVSVMPRLLAQIARDGGELVIHYTPPGAQMPVCTTEGAVLTTNDPALVQCCGKCQDEAWEALLRWGRTLEVIVGDALNGL